MASFPWKSTNPDQAPENVSALFAYVNLEMDPSNW